MCSATFDLVYTCRTTAIFGTLKAGRLQMNNFASKIVLFSIVSSKMASTFCLV